jgi:hypothetical protein
MANFGICLAQFYFMNTSWFFLHLFRCLVHVIDVVCCSSFLFSSHQCNVLRFSSHQSNVLRFSSLWATLYFAFFSQLPSVFRFSRQPPYALRFSSPPPYVSHFSCQPPNVLRFSCKPPNVLCFSCQLSYVCKSTETVFCGFLRILQSRTFTAESSWILVILNLFCRNQ